MEQIEKLVKGGVRLFRRKQHYKFRIIRHRGKSSEEVIQDVNFTTVRGAYDHMTLRDQTKEFTHRHYKTVTLHIREKGIYTDQFSNGFYWEIKREYVY